MESQLIEIEVTVPSNSYSIPIILQDICSAQQEGKLILDSDYGNGDISYGITTNKFTYAFIKVQASQCISIPFPAIPTNSSILLFFEDITEYKPVQGLSDSSLSLPIRVFVWSCQVHQTIIWKPTEHVAHHLCFIIDEEWLASELIEEEGNRFIEDVKKGKLLQSTYLTIPAFFVEKLQKLTNLSSPQTHSKRLFDASLFFAIHTLIGSLQEQHNATAISFSQRDTEKVRRYVQSLLHRFDGSEPTIAEASSEVGMSTTKFKALFKSVYGKTYHAYFLEIRMHKAIQLLKATDQSVFEIGQQVGFTHPSNFTKAFHKQFGLTPSAYQRMIFR